MKTSKINKRIIGLMLLSLVVILAGCGKKSDMPNQTLLEKVKSEGIVVGSEGIYRPYSYHNEEDELTGYDVEVVREIFNRLDINVTFSETQWDGLLAGLETNRFDMIANQVWRNETREEIYTLSDAYMYAGAVLIVNEENGTIKTIEDIEGKVGAHTITSAYADMSKNAGAEVVSVNSFVEAAENVKFGRVDYTINDKDSFIQYQISNPDSGLIGYDIDSADKIDVVFALPKDGSAELVNEINRVLAKMYEDGTIGDLEEKFFD